MKAPTKIYAESAKKVAEIRRILCKDSTNVLAERLGITPQSASNLVHGYSGIGKTTADKIITAFPEISPEWLLAGEGPMLVDGDGSQRVEEVIPKCDLISTHTARRTFVVTALTLGVPAEVVMRWTGHADWASMRPYVAIVDELKKKEMGRFDGI